MNVLQDQILFHVCVWVWKLRQYLMNWSYFNFCKDVFLIRGRIKHFLYSLNSKEKTFLLGDIKLIERFKAKACLQLLFKHELNELRCFFEELTLFIIKQGKFFDNVFQCRKCMHKWVVTTGL